ncbi:MAG: hypothetical protein ACRDIU_11340, partial [Actinomycetota bacterium]
VLSRRRRHGGTLAAVVLLAGSTGQPASLAAGTSGGIITTVAGGASSSTGVPAADGRGDGGLATSASGLMPTSVELDPMGEALYLSSGGGVRLVNLGRDVMTRHGVTVAPGAIETVAGDLDYPTAAGRGINGAPYNGDGTPATKATLGSPKGLSLDAAGNLYIADPGQKRVRKVDTDGIISTVAGMGENFSTLFFCSLEPCRGTPLYPRGGEGAPALEVYVVPEDVAVAPNGEIYIADPDTNQIRKVQKVGGQDRLSTVAGSGLNGYGGDGGPAIGARMARPAGIEFYEGNLLIADTENGAIRLVNLGSSPVAAFGKSPIEPGDIGTIAGGVSGSCSTPGPPRQFSHPTDISLDSSGHLVIADPWCFKVHKVSAAGVVTTAAGSGASGPGQDGVGPTESAVTPDDVSADGRGNFYIA